MTNLCYQSGCAGGSKARGEASPWFEGGRVVVGFNNGNVNNNDDNNRAFARAVRVSGECQGADGKMLFHELYDAYRDARRGKKPSLNKLAFDVRWADGLIDLERRIATGTWQPAPYTCFVATAPKAREIHAPDFGDRVGHHWAVGKVQPGYERIFIEDSYANRPGKGCHAAVQRARQFIRQVHSGQGRGFYLQLDIANFFYSIPRKRLWRILKTGMQRDGVPLEAQHFMHALLRRSAKESGVRYRSTPAQRALVPRHKQLAHAAPGCGLPIGNLPSQFLANVYMNELDQFVKHVLKAKRYIRYVDDFVLFHHDRAQLERWLVEIERFLADHLQLKLKDDIRLRPLTDGLDFLGYVIYPTHSRVRRRVVAHARAAFSEWEREHVRSRRLVATPDELRRFRNRAASYDGHFRHANSFRLRVGMHRRFPWLHEASLNRRFHLSIELSIEHRRLSIRWQESEAVALPRQPRGSGFRLNELLGCRRLSGAAAPGAHRRGPGSTGRQARMKSALIRATFAQRSRIVMLLARVEFDTHTVTYAYRRLGVPEAVIGRPVDSWLDGLTIDEVSVVIRKLEEMT